MSRGIAILLGLGCAALLGLAAWRWRAGRERAQVELVDTHESLDALLGARALERGGPESAPERLARGTLDAQALHLFFPAAGGPAYVPNPQCYVARRPLLELWQPFAEHPAGGYHVRTNSLGLRADRELASERPALRVLVIGDSHVDGVCENSESACALLEADLARERGGGVECLNAGCGGSQPYAYLGVLERFAELRPAVSAVVLFGGNDFQQLAGLEAYFAQRAPRSTPRPYQPKPRELAEACPGYAGQELPQLLHFANEPRSEELSLATLRAWNAELRAAAERAGSELVCVYLPPASSGQPELFAAGLRACCERLGLPSATLAVADRLADAWLAQLRELGLCALDLRPALRALPEPAYWRADHHLNLLGQRALADALRAAIDGLPRAGRGRAAPR